MGYRCECYEGAAHVPSCPSSNLVAVKDDPKPQSQRIWRTAARLERAKQHSARNQIYGVPNSSEADVLKELRKEYTNTQDGGVKDYGPLVEWVSIAPHGNGCDLTRHRSGTLCSCGLTDALKAAGL